MANVGNMSNYCQSGVLTQIFRTGTFNKPDSIWIALLQNVWTNTDNGNTLKEIPNAGSYARQELDALDANWAFSFVNNSGSIQNSSAITFPAATADWGWVSGIAIVTSGVYQTGQVLFGGLLTTPKLIGNGDQFKSNAADIVIYLD